MISIKELLVKRPVFIGNWKSREEVLSDFSDGESFSKETEGVDILFASYGTGNYSGDAWVLVHKDGALYEINGSHCSCFGLEGQWSLEPITVEVLTHRLDKGSFGIDDWSDNNFKAELEEFLGVNARQEAER